LAGRVRIEAADPTDPFGKGNVFQNASGEICWDQREGGNRGGGLWGIPIVTWINAGRGWRIMNLIRKIRREVSDFNRLGGNGKGEK
jgi:hypothetical protein